MTSQAYGRHDLNEVTRLLLRSVGVGLFIAFTLLALQYPIERIAFTFIQTTEEVEHLAGLYFRICIWGAPAVLGLYSFAGWYIGMQNSRFPMYIAITQNIVNIAVSLLLVYGLGMKIEGVAIGTLTAQYAGLVMAYLLWLRYYSTLRKRIEWHSFFDKQAMYRFFQVNRDIFSVPSAWWRLLSFHLGRCGTRRSGVGGQYITYAIIHFILLHYGRLRIRRRSIDRKIYRSQ